MEGLAPGFKMLLRIEMELKKGESVRRAVLSFVEEPGLYQFKKEIKAWMTATENGWEIPFEQSLLKTPHRQSLLTVIELGLKGHSILDRLHELKIEFQRECDRQIQQALNDLPLKVLAPLTLCLFPAFLILLVGPLFAQLLGAFR